jgi:hypothetical protein
MRLGIVLTSFPGSVQRDGKSKIPVAIADIMIVSMIVGFWIVDASICVGDGVECGIGMNVIECVGESERRLP